MKARKSCFAVLLIAVTPAVAELPEGYWTVEQTQPILDATLNVTLDADLSNLTAAESQALQSLLAAGKIMHELYLEQLHAEALKAKFALDVVHAGGTDPAAVCGIQGETAAGGICRQVRLLLTISE